MTWLRVLVLRVVGWVRRNRLDEEFDEEVRFHLEMETAANVNRGLSPDEARRVARVRLGGAARVKEEVRETRGLRLLEELGRDLRYGLRMLRKAPGFAAVAILTLALGIGATTAIFTVINGVLLKPLPFEDPDALVSVWNRNQRSDGFDLFPGQHFTYRNENRVFEDIGSWDDQEVSVAGLAEPEQLPAMRVTASLLPLLRVQPVLGRPFTEEDDSPGSPETVMLSHAYWLRQFGSDPGVVGRILRVDGRPREIIGVLPSELALPQEAALYLPSQWGRDGTFNTRTIARLLPDATIERARADLERMLPIWVEQFPETLGITQATLEEDQWGAVLRPLKQDFVGDIGNVLWVLLGTVGIVLFMACANVANLFLVRAEARQQEVAVRTALGAARGQIAR